MKKTRTIIASIVMFLIVLLLIIIVVAVATRKPITSKSDEETSLEIAQDGGRGQGVNKNETSTDNNNAGMAEKDEQGESSDQQSEEDASDKNLPPVSNDGESATVQTTPEKEETEGEEVKTIEIGQSSEDLPKTGPESALPLAILLGTVTMFISSCICIREKRVI